MQRRAPLYDKGQEGHYNLISALHKSLRGSDTDAALYWLARMLAGGEDPIYILRRLTRAAVEDIGLADPQALVQALAAWDAYDRLGSPEGELAVAQLVIYLASAPKSNAAYAAFGEARAMAERDRLADAADAHPERADRADAQARLRQAATSTTTRPRRAFPARTISRTGSPRREFYRPTERGFEREIREAPRILGQAAAARRGRAGNDRRQQPSRCGRRTAPGGSTAGSGGTIPGLSHGRLEKLLRTGQIRVDGKRARAGDPVAPGQAIRVPPLAEPLAAPPTRPPNPRARRRMSRCCATRALPRRLGDRPQQAGRSRGAGRQQAPSGMSMRCSTACASTATSARAWCTGSTRTPRACC